MRPFPLIALITLAASSSAQSQSYAARTIIGRSLITDGALATETDFRKLHMQTIVPLRSRFLSIVSSCPAPGLQMGKRTQHEQHQR